MGNYKITVSRKRLAIERNGPKFGPWECVYTGYFCLLSVQGQSEVNRCICNFPILQPCISFSDIRQPGIPKRTGHRTNGIKILASGLSTYCIPGTFDRYVFKVRLRSLMLFRFANLVSRKLILRSGPCNEADQNLGPRHSTWYI